MPTRTWLDRLLEGSHRWGWVQVGTPGRGGWLTLRLAVYPPGTNAAERRSLTFARNWPVCSALIVLFASAAGAASIPPLVLVPASLLLYAGGVILVMFRTRRLRAGVRRISAAQVHSEGGWHDLGHFRAVSSAISELQELDSAEAAGAVSAVEYERRWALVFEAVGVDGRSRDVRAGIPEA